MFKQIGSASTSPSRVYLWKNGNYDEGEDDDEADEGGSRVREAEGGEQLLSVHEQAEHHEAHERVHLSKTKQNMEHSIR